MSNAAPLIAGLELGGTKCVALLARGPDQVLDRRTIRTTDPETTLGELEAVLAGWTFDAVGIASFGPLELNPASPDFGSITATTKPGWTGTDLFHRIAALAARPVAIQTDVNGAALAEGRWGAARGLASHAYITIGTGVGVGMISGGQPIQGFAHGEAGHMRVARMPGDAYPGWCPFHGDCIEGLIAGPALAQRFGCKGEELPADGTEWDLFVHDLAGLLHNLVVALAPERIAIGGGVMSAREQLFVPLRAALARSIGGYGSLSALDMDALVGAPGLGAMAGPMGAIAVGASALAG